MTLTKAELVDFLFDKVGTNKRVARNMVEALFEEVSIQFKRHESVKLSGFGNFQSRDKAARPGRYPKICADIPIAARRVIIFHPGQKLKSMVVKSYHGIPTRTI